MVINRPPVEMEQGGLMMLVSPGGGLREHFSDLEDPRASTKRQLLLEMIVIAIVICAADGREDAELFGQSK
jgi:hypothetical protein